MDLDAYHMGGNPVISEKICSMVFLLHNIHFENQNWIRNLSKKLENQPKSLPFIKKTSYLVMLIT